MSTKVGNVLCRGTSRHAASQWPPKWVQDSAPVPAAQLPPPEPVIDPSPEPQPPWPPRPAELARWPVERREQWGRLANQLEDEGVQFPESERRAFHQVKAEMGAIRQRLARRKTAT
jgi:hypothetical protein